jgi:hypothetical protein
VINDVFIEISCDEIEKKIKENHMFFVYYGFQYSLEGKTKYSHLRQVVAHER